MPLTLSELHPRTFPASKVTEVWDGDTLRVELNLGFGVHYGTKVRLAHVNAPELSTVAGLAAKAFVLSWITGPVTVVAYETAVGLPVNDKWGRPLVVIVRNGETLHAALLASGNAVPFEG